MKKMLKMIKHDQVGMNIICVNKNVLHTRARRFCLHELKRSSMVELSNVSFPMTPLLWMFVVDSRPELTLRFEESEDE
jgi:hypothetical protein